jgi:beta-glucosidase/6-phospho-beta-glucosidase/beta-galactosidase
MTILDVLNTLGRRGPRVAMVARLVIALAIVFSLFVQPVAEAVTSNLLEQAVVQPASPSLPGRPFLWGAATSSYQVEGGIGGIDCDERAKPCNDYDLFNSHPRIRARVSYNSRLAGPRLNLAAAGIADNAWDPPVYKRDFDYAKTLGLNSFRFSLEWGRIEPQQDQWDDAAIEHYRAMVDAMIARGLKPIMTINHFTLPLWVLRPPTDSSVCDPVRCHPTDGESNYRKSLRGWENPQVLSQSGASAGTFTLTVTPPGGSPRSTGPIPFNASALRVLAALVALPGVRLGDVQVDGGPLGSGRVYVKFKGQYLNKDVGLAVDGSGLDGGSIRLTSTLDQYLEFVRRVVFKFRDKVDYWLTINEPVGTINLGYVAGIWSPGFLLDGRKAKEVMHNLILAHVRAYDIISNCTNNPDCDNVDADGDGRTKVVGFAHAMHSVAASPNDPAAPSNAIAASNYEYFLNDYFVNAVTKGEEDINYLESAGSDQGVNVAIHNDWKHHLDFLGINYYRRSYIAHSDILAISGTGFVGGQPQNNLFGEPEPHSLLNDLGWANYPQGLYELIMRSKTKWNLPVLITENGIAERNDRNRAPFIVAHLREVQRAISDGANVIGYLHWSLMDNWELQEHYHPQAQFGLLHIDRNETDRTGNLVLHRALTEGALAYQQVIEESHAVNPTTGAPTKAAIDNAQDKFGAFTRNGKQLIAPTHTHGRLWEGPTTEGQATLYLGSITASQRIVGMIYWHSRREWRNVELLMDARGPLLRERLFNDAAEATVARDIRVTYTSGAFGFPGGHTLTRISGTGLWRWASGASPWGTNAFYVSKLEGAYTGKYFTFSNPGPDDVPNPPPCGAGGCVPQASGTTWKALRPEAHPAPGADLRLNGYGREGEGLFDVFLSLSNPSIGSSIATTIVKGKGSFSISKELNSLPKPFRFTGYIAPSQDNAWTWTGKRNGSTVSTFQFLERRGIFTEFPRKPTPVPDREDQYWRENDPTSVMPLVGFKFTPLETRLGVVTKARISWEAGGRHYTLQSSIPHCLWPTVCDNGAWTDIGGRIANRVSERFPPAVGQFANRRIAANTNGGATVSATPPPALDLDGGALSYTWTGPFGTATGTSPRFFLPLGRQTVCVEIAGPGGSAKRCATYSVIDTLPPLIMCGSADGIWHATDVRIHCMASDLGSGLADPADANFSLPTSVTAGTETVNAQTSTRKVCDRAENCATAGPVGGNRIDKKVPAIAIVQPTATHYVHSAKLTLDYAASDSGSGVKRVTASLDGSTVLEGHGLQSGQVIRLLTELSLGPHTFAVTAADNVGNTATRSVTFTIIVTPESIKQDVADFLAAGAIRNRGLARSLLAKLDAAAAAQARHNCATAANIYSAFINQLNALSGHGVDSAAAAIMMADARYLIAHCWALTGLQSSSNVERSSERATMPPLSVNGSETATDIQRHPNQSARDRGEARMLGEGEHPRGRQRRHLLAADRHRGPGLGYDVSKGRLSGPIPASSANPTPTGHRPADRRHSPSPRLAPWPRVPSRDPA